MFSGKHRVAIHHLARAELFRGESVPGMTNPDVTRVLVHTQNPALRLDEKSILGCSGLSLHGTPHPLGSQSWDYMLSVSLEGDVSITLTIAGREMHQTAQEGCFPLLPSFPCSLVPGVGLQ